MPLSRRFPAPWTVRELNQAFVVSDANGQVVDPNEARQAKVIRL